MNLATLAIPENKPRRIHRIVHGIRQLAGNCQKRCPFDKSAQLFKVKLLGFLHLKLYTTVPLFQVFIIRPTQF